MLEKAVLTMSGLYICLIIRHAPQAFEDVLGSKSVRVLNMALLYMQRLHGVPNRSDYVSIRLNNV